MKQAPVMMLTALLALSGCFSDTTDIQQFMADVKATTRLKFRLYLL
ncbi:hypothetical protein [Rheinheimera sp. KL1]|nr:hypothetical protein [Rheinheimera sp. KL1]